MSYQRLSCEAKPCAYIYMSHDGLHAWFAAGKNVEAVTQGDPARVLFSHDDTETAENLFLALADFLKGSGKKIDFNKKTGEISIRRRRK